MKTSDLKIFNRLQNGKLYSPDCANSKLEELEKEFQRNNPSTAIFKKRVKKNKKINKGKLKLILIFLLLAVCGLTLLL